MKVVIEVNVDSDAFAEDCECELKFVLRAAAGLAATRITSPTLPVASPLLDSNGNTCGSLTIEA